MEITIREPDRAHAADLNLKNDPFPIFGRLVPAYTDGKWSHTEELFPEVSEMVFSDAGYDYDKTTAAGPVLAAYDGDKCVGLAVFETRWFKYLYLADLNVQKDYRRRGIAGKLLEAGMDLARQRGLRGLWIICQDNNLAAARFYLKHGCRIGGLDTEVYNGTSQEGKKDISFYKDAET